MAEHQAGSGAGRQEARQEAREAGASPVLEDARLILQLPGEHGCAARARALVPTSQRSCRTGIWGFSAHAPLRCLQLSGRDLCMV